MIRPMRRPAVLLLLAVIATHLAVACLWLGRDEGLLDGDELGVLGAVELFWGQTHADGAAAALASSYLEDYGEYPALHYAITGVALAWLGVEDLDGDGPRLVALGWGVLALLATAWLAVECARWTGTEATDGGALAAALLAASPLWAGTQRHLLLENAVCALVALATAAYLAARRAAPDRPPVGPGWVIAAALLVKQTALLALAAAGLGILARAPRRRTELLALAWVAGIGGLLVAWWYARHLLFDGGYLAASAGANPDSVGVVHQLAIYPLVLAQQAWAPAIWLLLGGLLAWRRPADRGWVLPATIVGIGLLILLPIPKKYPRLLLPLLPFGAVALALALRGLPRAAHAGLAAALALSLIGSSFGIPPLLGPTDVGLRQLDERCPQRWMTEPSRPGLPWDALVAAAEANGPGRDYRLGAVDWPAPPCGYQTSHDLGEHLRIRLRRAGSEADVGAGRSFVQADGWGTDGPPDVLLHAGPLVCGEPPGAAGAGDVCAGRGWREVAALPFEHPAWSVDLRLSVPAVR